MRCLSVLDLVILFYLFIFFLGREAQKVVTYPLKHHFWNGDVNFILFVYFFL